MEGLQVPNVNPFGAVQTVENRDTGICTSYLIAEIPALLC